MIIKNETAFKLKWLFSFSKTSNHTPHFPQINHENQLTKKRTRAVVLKTLHK